MKNKKRIFNIVTFYCFFILFASCGGNAQNETKKDSSKQNKNKEQYALNSEGTLFDIPKIYKDKRFAGKYYFPQIDLKKLFHDVSVSGIFSDSKMFADANLKKPIEEILTAYEKQSSKDGFSLSKFVEDNFIVNSEKPSIKNVDPATLPTMKEHIEKLWGKLIKPGEEKTKNKNTKIVLPFGYVVPGGRFREFYYWDTYFTVLGLLESNHKKESIMMLDNYKFLIEDELGYIPNGTRTYYVGRSQPPMFGMMLKAVFGTDYKKMEPYMDALVKENDFWMNTSISTDSKDILSDNRVVQFEIGKANRYFSNIHFPRTESYKEDVHLFFKKYGKITSYTKEQLSLFTQIRSVCESGWDFSTRWYEDPKDNTTIEIVDLMPTDLNSILFLQERLLAEYFKHFGNQKLYQKYSKQFEERKKIILKYNWNTKLEFFTDYNFTKKTSKNHLNLSGAFPLFANIATKEQAADVAKLLEEKFLKPGGLLTTLEDSSEQWDSPHGWAPLEYIAIKGLLNYGYKDLAMKIKNNWIKCMYNYYQKTGTIMEKYDVINIDATHQSKIYGEYPNQEGFGWTNGVYLKILKLK